MRDILLALERIYRPSFAELNLQQWTGSISIWLTHPLLDPQKSGRVLMDHLMKLITTALEWSYAEAQKDVNPKHLEAAAEHLTLRRDVMYLIDAVKSTEEEDRKEGPSSESHPKGGRTLSAKKFALNVRRDGSQLSILVRSFSAITNRWGGV